MRLAISGNVVGLAALVSAAIVGAAAPVRAQSAPPTASDASAAAPFEVPAWAFPLPAPAKAAPLDSGTLLHLPKSPRAFTAVQVRDQYNVPDWYPASHPRMPSIVEHGRRPAIIACGFCHLPNGAGRPENATLAGLPAPYIAQQVADMRSGARRIAWHGPYRPSDLMRGIADSISNAEVAAAARYFSRLRAPRRSQVIEAASLPHPEPALGLYMSAPGAELEPLGHRLIEVAVDPAAHEMRDARAAYVTYVPPGSIARGRRLATTVTKSTPKPCVSCHGPQLRGVGLVPPIAGRSPSYILRQLLAFRAGTRSAAASAPMRDVAGGLDIDEMIAAAAYAGSRQP